MLQSCIIIEDQPPAQRILQKFINDIGTLELKGTFSNAIDAISFLQQQSVDLIFLDIHLPKISGMDFLKTLKNSPQVILTTAFSEYALESYEYNVIDYLLKPFSFQRFVQAVAKCEAKNTGTKKEKTQENSNEFFFIKSGYDLVKIKRAEIQYIKADTDYTEIITANKTYLSTDTLKKWTEKLNPATFCRIHKSFIVNTTFLQKITGNQVVLLNEKTLPIGRAYKDDFLKKFVN